MKRIQDDRPEGARMYYDADAQQYVMRNARGVWMLLGAPTAKQELLHRGVVRGREKGDEFAPVDAALYEVRNAWDVAYSGPLAGHEAGLYEHNKQRIVVTVSPEIPTPSPGDWMMLDSFLSQMFAGGRIDQRERFFAWLRWGYTSLTSQTCAPGQALSLCGPRNAGKSLVSEIITSTLGGRIGRPFQFLTGETSFNADLFQAEHLCIDDEANSTDIRARRQFGAALKRICGLWGQRLHRKNVDAVELQPFWRLSIMLNEETENLQVLPPIDDGIEDKLLILKVHKAPFTWPMSTPKEKAEALAALKGQIPAMLDWLLNIWQPAPAMLSERYGCAPWIHPEIRERLDATAPEIRLLTLIDAVLFSDPLPLTWTGTAEELENKLIGSDSAHEARRLLSWSFAAGTYLGRLASRYPKRVRHAPYDGKRRKWIIEPDEGASETASDGTYLHPRSDEGASKPWEGASETA